MVLKRILITGIRGVPASHGGFETFAENLAVFLVEKGWQVTVYCQESGTETSEISESVWHGVRRVHIPVKGEDAKATIVFDYLTVKHASKQPGLVLTLGYNTAIFNLLFRLKEKKNLINMDGVEWMRDKWKWYEKVWLYFNERAGYLIGNQLIADHPEIQKHLMSRVSDSKITMIPYGARDVLHAEEKRLAKFGLSAHEYAIVIARPEPENSILEIVRAFSTCKRDKKLVMLGNYSEYNAYHQLVKMSASSDVLFVGAIYDHADLDALRFYSCLYLHGHTVGGTNPSLIEALGAGQPVLAHHNKFNSWVAGEGAVYFRDEKQCADEMNELLHDGSRLNSMSLSSKKRFQECFTWPDILGQYEDLLLQWI